MVNDHHCKEDRVIYNISCFLFMGARVCIGWVAHVCGSRHFTCLLQFLPMLYIEL